MTTTSSLLPLSHSSTSARRSGPFIGLMFLLLVIDQFSKIWIKTHMMLGEEIYVFDWFRIHFVENPGMAYGLELFNKLFLTLFRIVVMGIAMYVLLYAVKHSRYKSAFCVLLTLVITGGIGNILDSIFYGVLFDSSVNQVAQLFPPDGGYAPLFKGYVVDMLYFPIWHTQFPTWVPFVGGQDYTFFSPVFNFADSCITVGVICLLLFYSRSSAMALEEGIDHLLYRLKIKKKVAASSETEE